MHSIDTVCTCVSLYRMHLRMATADASAITFYSWASVVKLNKPSWMIFRRVQRTDWWDRQDTEGR